MMKKMISRLRTWNNERQKRIAQDDLTDIHLYLNLMMLRNFQTKSKVQNIERLEELIKKIEKWIKDEGIRR